MGAMTYRIRPARAEEAALLPEIERDAARRFHTVDMPKIAEGDPLPVWRFADYIADGRALVCTSAADQPIGFLIWDIYDGDAYIHELDVMTAHAGHRLASRMIDAMAAEAAKRSLMALSLTTFRTVPWNAPYYARLGFRILEPGEIGPELRMEIMRQREYGLDISARVAMRRPVPA